MVDTVRLRVSEQEKGWLQAAALVQGVTLSAFIRAAVLRNAAQLLGDGKPLPLSPPIEATATRWAKRLRKQIEASVKTGDDVGSVKNFEPSGN